MNIIFSKSEQELHDAFTISHDEVVLGGSRVSKSEMPMSHDDGEQEAPEDPGEDGTPELVTWQCKKGHTWKTYGEVAFMTFIDPLSSEEISTGPICVKCYFKNLTDYFSAERKDTEHGYRP